MSHRRFPSKSLFFGIALVAGMLVLISFVLRVIDKVLSGRGNDFYFTGHGVRMNYIGVLIAIVAIPVALIIGWAMRYWSLRDKRDFGKRYCKKNRTS